MKGTRFEKTGFPDCGNRLTRSNSSRGFETSPDVIRPGMMLHVLYLAMSVFPIFMMPVLTRWTIAHLLQRAAKASTISPVTVAKRPAS